MATNINFPAASYLCNTVTLQTFEIFGKASKLMKRQQFVIVDYKIKKKPLGECTFTYLCNFRNEKGTHTSNHWAARHRHVKRRHDWTDLRHHRNPTINPGPNPEPLRPPDRWFRLRISQAQSPPYCATATANRRTFSAEKSSSRRLRKTLVAVVTAETASRKSRHSRRRRRGRRSTYQDCPRV